MTRQRKRLAFRVLALAALMAAGVGSAHATTICEVQEYDDMGFSPLAGQIVTVRGKLTFPPGLLVAQYTSIYLESDDCGLNVFVPVDWTTLPYAFALGDSFQITGEVEEYISDTTGAGAVTEIVVGERSITNSGSVLYKLDEGQ